MSCIEQLIGNKKQSMDIKPFFPIVILLWLLRKVVSHCHQTKKNWGAQHSFVTFMLPDKGFTKQKSEITIYYHIIS